MTSRPRSILLGTAVGDSLGLPAEGLSRERIARRWAGVWRQRLLLGHGMVSDDTEHTVFTLQALVESQGDGERFRRRLAWKLRWWLVCLPAGIGFATLRAVGKLWLGWPARSSGVYSAGNGPAMRSAIIGAYWANEESDEPLRAMVRVSTRLTHTDPRAEIGALAVALTARALVRREAAGCDTTADRSAWLALLRGEWDGAGWISGASDEEWARLMGQFWHAYEEGRSVAAFAESLGLARGVTGYIYHTVPVALYAVLRHDGDPRAALEAILNCGGDTDSTGAIVGALSAISGDLPEAWLTHLVDWPISRGYLERLGAAAEKGEVLPGLAWWGLPLRNFFFLAVVLVHGLGRLWR